MKQRYRLFKRGWGTYYFQDVETGKQESLKTRDKHQARTLVHTMNEAVRQPMLNLDIARAYLKGSDSGFNSRTWAWVMERAGEGKQGATKERWLRAVAEKPFDIIRDLKLTETKAEHLLSVLKEGTVSTNIFLRRLHNFALDMNWLLAPIIPRRQWRPVKFQEKRAITLDEHQKILAGERNEEWRAFYEMLWHLGGSQSDVATLQAENVDWKNRTIAYSRMKTGSHALIRFGESVGRILQSRPRKGLLFPQIGSWKESDRAKAFSRRRALVGINGITLHSYRYAWAERALTAGYPERYAQQALGHRSRAVHTAYARRALVEVPSLEQYEQPEPSPR
ncbi:MAG TPA: tyrosine-type recombinase/integrase [Candidatus Angelobacter sp.]|nr:tyrosine-type recombinase/integrase [Candidatus Angelobacter sp.]